jgi:MinD superfamily P-loop ATPase
MQKNNFTIAILSTKGGVGKTTLAVSLIDLLARANYKINAVDCDVHSPDLTLRLGGVKNWDKISPIKIFPLPNKYKSCKKIKVVCDNKLVDIEDEKRGEIKIKEGFSPKFGEYRLNLIAGDLDKNKTGSGKVAEGVIKTAKSYDYEVMIIDSAPGSGYPILAPLKTSDFAILITEPTILGFNDLMKLVEIVEINKKNYGIIVNKWSINPKLGEEIKNWAKKKFLGEIDFSPEIEQSLMDRVPPTIKKTKISEQIRTCFTNVLQNLNSPRNEKNI